MKRPALASLALAVLATVGAGCGIPEDRAPTLMPGGVVTPPLAPSEPDPPGTSGAPPAPDTRASVYLVQGQQLVKVERSTGRDDLPGVLGRLLAGPKEAEFAAGIRTAISPQALLRSVRLDGDTAIVDLSAAFVEVGGEEQILAVAQIVLTATAVAGVGRVRFLLEGQAVEIPRADGTLTSEALRAEDYEGLLGPAS